MAFRFKKILAKVLYASYYTLVVLELKGFEGNVLYYSEPSSFAVMQNISPNHRVVPDSVDNHSRAVLSPIGSWCIEVTSIPPRSKAVRLRSRQSTFSA